MSGKGESSFAGSGTSADAESLDLYESTAKYYDIWRDDLRDDVDFYLALAERTAGPVLEPMCGTGRLLAPFAQAGYEITGVDRSPAMLDVCTKRVSFLRPEVQQRIDIVQADIRDVRLDRQFNLVVVPRSSFLHLLERRDREDALRTIKEHLAEGGLFSFAVFNPRLDRPEGLLRHRGTRLTAQGEVISWFESQTFDRAAQRTTVTYFYDISRQDRPVRRVSAVFVLRYLFYQEALDLLDRCGFEVVETYGDYRGTPFSSASELMVFVARKKQE